MPDWLCLADSQAHLPAAYGSNQPTSASALEGLAELLGESPQAAQLRTAVAAYQAQNPLYRELNYISRDLEEYCFLQCVAGGDDAEWGSRLGRHLHFSYYGLLGYLMLLSADLGTALATALQFPLQLGSYFSIRLLHCPASRRAQLRFEHYQGRPELFRFHLRLCAEAYRQILATLGVVDGSAFATEYRDQGGKADALCFHAEVLALPLPYAQSSVFAQTLRQCCELERQIGDLLMQPLVLKVRTLMAADLKRYSAMPAMAAELHMTERTLHRHLRKCGTSFQNLLDDTRLHQAMALLHSRQHTPAQIAEALGFADPAAFKHAFKRWTGSSPAAWQGR